MCLDFPGSYFVHMYIIPCSTAIQQSVVHRIRRERPLTPWTIPERLHAPVDVRVVGCTTSTPLYAAGPLAPALSLPLPPLPLSCSPSMLLFMPPSTNLLGGAVVSMASKNDCSLRFSCASRSSSETASSLVIGCGGIFTTLQHVLPPSPAAIHQAWSAGLGPGLGETPQ